MKIINYEEEFGKINFPEGFEETLKGLTIEEQMNRYRVTLTTVYANTNWKQRINSWDYIQLDKVSDVRALIVKNGLVVGAMILGEGNEEVPCLGEGRVCTYYASDNNGAGYKTRIDYTYLLCVPENF